MGDFIPLLLFSPFVMYEDTHWMSLETKVKKEINTEDISRNRDQLSSEIGIWTIPVIMAVDLILVLLLTFHDDFKYNEDIIWCKETTVEILLKVVIVSGVSAFIACICFRLKDYDANSSIARIGNKFKLMCRAVGMTIASIIVIIAIVVGLTTIDYRRCHITNNNITSGFKL